MIRPLALAFAATSVLATLGCSALTRPDEISITAEPVREPATVRPPSVSPGVHAAALPNGAGRPKAQAGGGCGM